MVCPALMLKTPSQRVNARQRISALASDCDITRSDSFAQTVLIDVCERDLLVLPLGMVF